MAVKEIEMIELEVEESKKTKISLEQELTKMHQHYEETTLRANERNRSLQSELENMKNRVQASAAKAEEMEKAQMEALQQIQMERANFASEKEEMLKRKRRCAKSFKPTRSNTRGNFQLARTRKEGAIKRENLPRRFNARRRACSRVHAENYDFANGVGL